MTRRSAWLAALAAVLVVGSCAAPPPTRPDPVPRFLVGDAYQLGGVWQYPQLSFTADQSGLADVMPTRVGFTANGERLDQSALIASHRRLQLPAIALVTNLENGRQVLVRINDRGPADPGRLIGLSRRAAELLQATAGTRIRLQVQEGESRQLAAEMSGDGPKLDLTTAPRAAIGSEQLAPPPGVGLSGRGRVAPSAPVVAGARSQPVIVPQRLPEEVRQVPPRPGALFVDLGAFSGLTYANLMAARMVSLGARVTTNYNAPRDRAYIVRVGPLATVAEADRMLTRAQGAGVNDAAIVVE